jgi:hypothetical protein
MKETVSPTAENITTVFKILMSTSTDAPRAAVDGLRQARCGCPAGFQ